MSFAAGAGVWLLGSSIYWLVGAALVGSVVPFTFAAIMPTNKRLLASDQYTPAATIRALLEHWARLHAVRTGLSTVGTIVYLGQLLRA